MSFTDILSTIFEFILVTFTIWAVFNENKFIIIEERLFCNIKRKKLKIAKHNRSSSHKIYEYFNEVTAENSCSKI